MPLAQCVLDPEPGETGQGKDGNAADDQRGQRDAQQAFQKRIGGEDAQSAEGANGWRDCRKDVHGRHDRMIV